MPLIKLHRVIPSVDLLDHKAVSVFLQSAGIVVKVVSNFDDAALFLWSSTGHLYLELQGGGGVAFGEIDAFQIEVAVGGGAAAFGDTLYGNLLDHTFLSGYNFNDKNALAKALYWYHVAATILADKCAGC